MTTLGRVFALGDDDTPRLLSIPTRRGGGECARAAIKPPLRVRPTPPLALTFSFAALTALRLSSA